MKGHLAPIEITLLVWSFAIFTPCNINSNKYILSIITSFHVIIRREERGREGGMDGGREGGREGGRAR